MTSRFDEYVAILASRDNTLIVLGLLAVSVAVSWWVVDRLHISDHWKGIIQNCLFGMVLILAGLTAILGVAE
jgi:hypothetical protein